MRCVETDDTLRVSERVRAQVPLGWSSNPDNMGHSVLAAVLALLMLMPPGICICGGGARPCPNHPIVETDSVTTEPQLAGERELCCGGANVGNTQAEHHCPDPLPHDPSCPVVAPPTDQTPPENVHSVAPDLFAEAVVVHLTYLTTRRPITSTSVHVSHLPLFLAHCALLI